MDAQSPTVLQMPPRRRGGITSRLRSGLSSASSFSGGVANDERLEDLLDEGSTADVLVLHHRSLGGGRGAGDIDHLAVTPSGIYVIDEKYYENAKIEIRRARGAFSSCVERLHVQGHDATSFVNGSDRKVQAVRKALADLPVAAGVTVRGVLCFIAAKLPASGSRELDGVSVLGPRLTAGLLGTDGPISLAARHEIYTALAQRLPAAA